MSDATQPQTIQINLRDIGMRYLRAMQRVFDLASMTVGSLRTINEREYDAFARSARFLPSAQHRLDFSAAQNQAEAFLLKNLLAEALAPIVPFLEDCRTVAALARWKAAGAADPSVAKKIITSDRQAFLKLPVAEMLAHLKQEYAIGHATEGSLPGFIKLAQCLAARGGVVSQEDATDGDHLVVHLVTVEQAAPEAHGQPPRGRLAESPRRFKVGAKAELRKEETLNAIATVALFVAGTMQSVAEFTKKTLPGEGTV